MALVILLITEQRTNEQIILFTQRHFINSGRSLAQSIQAALRQANSNRAREQLMGAVADPFVQQAILLDQTDIIRYSTRLIQVSKPVVQFDLAVPPSLLEEARTSLQPQIATINETSTIHLLFPVRLEPLQGELIPSRIGLLIVTYDFSQWRQDAQLYALESSALITKLMILLCIITAAVIHLGVTRRVSHLVKATNKIAHGQFDSIDIKSGNDEIGKLGLAISTMAAELQPTITNLVNSQAQIRSIMNSAADGIFLIDANGTIASANARAAELFQYKESELQGMSINQLLAFDNRQPLIESIQHHLTQHHRNLIGADACTLTGIRCSGEKFPIELAAGRLINGQKHQWVGIVRDISYRKNLEMQLHHAQKMESIGRLTAGVAHDFNNLLTVIQGNIEVLKSMNPSSSEEASECYNDALVAVQRGSALTRQLLAFGRRSVLQPTVLDLDSVLHDLKRLLSRTFPASINVTTTPGNRLWPTHLDQSLLNTALLNLAFNARDAMPEGGQLTLGASNEWLDDDDPNHQGDHIPPGFYVAIAITDTGQGIPESILGRVFEPFFTTKPMSSGSGLGLSMVHGFTKQSGGTMHISSQAGRGTTVKLFFPVTDKASFPLNASYTNSTKIPHGDENILLVEDNQKTGESITCQLTNLGYRITTTDNDTQALAIVRQEPSIALILIDLIEPGPAQGNALVNRIRRQSPKLPIIFISGYPVEITDTTDNLIWNNLQLTKPVQLAHLAQALRHALNRGK